ncbi:MAG TPA: MFS transporter [Phycisphaerales bacterium]|nr:MFS transporter [Phycisphaerales bacterium]
MASQVIGTPGVQSDGTRGKTRFASSFWCLNVIEMFERLAFYAFRPVAPIYIAQADDPGGLHMTQAHRGQVYLWWGIFQSLILPIFTGGFADRYGYKRMLTISFTLMVTGYVLMAFMRDLPPIFGYQLQDYPAFFAALLVMATGTAFFKPSIQGSLAQNLDKSNSSLGWGIFYWVVNIGGFIGPFIATFLLAHPPKDMPPAEAVEFGKAAWRNLFLAGAAIHSLNFIMLFTFKDVPSGADKTAGPLEVLWRTFINIFEPRLLVWILIMSGFWMMMYQLWDLHPNFIADWVDTSPAARRLGWLPDWLHSKIVQDTPRGPQIPQQIIANINGFMIILCVIPVSWMVRRMRTLSAMLIGMMVATVGILVAGLTNSVWVLALGIVFFSLGEMTTGPKKSEYLALIAPPGKKGLYLGYVNMPVGIGPSLGALLASYLYGHYGDKAVLAQRYLLEKTPFGAEKVFNWDGDVTTLGALLEVPRTEAMAKLQEVTGLDGLTATQLLWDTYQPAYPVWLPFAAVGVVCAFALYIYGRMAKRWDDMNA